LAFASCKKEKNQKNNPPVANAGSDQVITMPVAKVLLDGRGSSDIDGIIAAILWSQISGPNKSVIINPLQFSTEVTNLTLGTYSFELKVTDDAGLSAKDTVRVFVNAPGGSVSREILFNDLTWLYYNGWGMDDDEIFLITQDRPDLFVETQMNVPLPADVSIRFDTATNWIPVSTSRSDTFRYSTIRSRLLIHSNHLDHQLIGKKASIQVKFR
jgi:hypothetical protein